MTTFESATVERLKTTTSHPASGAWLAAVEERCRATVQQRVVGQLLQTPMIARAGGPGSMPFGKGEVVNPFHRLRREA